MKKVDKDRFLELVKLSRTVDEQLLEATLGEATATDQATAESLAEHFVSRGLLTRWQCDNLLAGKHKGFRLGNYRLKRKLGRGGMSTVYLAEHALMKREAAIKVLPRRRVEDSSYLARFHREAQAAAALDHPNIVRIYDVTADGNTHFIAMEFIDGPDLQTRVAKDGRLDPDLAADYIAQSAIGLQHAHDNGLIHRDIKPANLLANEHGIIKILDMGLAKFEVDDDKEASLTKDHNENVLGTVDYLSPEQARDSHGVDHRADIYSLGCTLYFLLVGHAPFPEGSLAQRILKHQQQKPTPIEEKRDGLPKRLIEICNHLMEKDPDKRPQCGNDAYELLGEYLASRGKTITGAGNDSGMGSRIGEAAAAAKVIAASYEPPANVKPMDVDSLIAVEEEDTSSARRDTKITRSQDETRKNVKSPKKTLIKEEKAKSTPSKKAKPAVEAPVEDDVSDVDINELQEELSPINSAEDRLMSAPVKVGTRLQSRDQDEGIPTWVWIAVGVGVLVLLVVVAAIALF